MNTRDKKSGEDVSHDYENLGKEDGAPSQADRMREMKMRRMKRDRAQVNQASPEDKARLECTRSFLNMKVQARAEAVLQGIVILDQMVENDNIGDIRFPPSVFDKAKEHILDKVFSKIKDFAQDAVAEGLNISKKIAGHAMTALEMAKGYVDDKAKKDEKLTAYFALTHMKAGLEMAMGYYRAACLGEVAQLTYTDLKEIDSKIAPFTGNEESKEDGGTMWFEIILERLFGFEKTGGAEMEAIAKAGYIQLRADIRASKPVAEQSNELQNIGKLGNEAQEKVEIAEKDVGVDKEVQRDKSARAFDEAQIKNSK